MTIRIGKISYWHVHAWDYTKQAQEHEDTVLVAVWDEDAERGKKAAESLNVPFFESLDEPACARGYRCRHSGCADQCAQRCNCCYG